MFHQDISSRIYVPGEGKTKSATQTAQRLGRLQDALQEGRTLLVSGDGIRSLRRDDDKQWLMVQSAGSTGSPKVIRRSPASWMASFGVTKDNFQIDKGATYATLGALEHSLTLYASLEALHIGCDLVALEGQLPRGQSAALRQEKVQVLYATPTQLRRLLTSDRDTCPDLKWVFCGGGFLDTETRLAVTKFAPNAVIHAFFGASETSFITMTDEHTPAGSVGKAYPCVEIFIDADAPEAVGEIWVKSPYLFDGYEEGTSAETRFIDGFVSIGEIGRLDERGYLVLLGRKSRMVGVADQNVFLEVVEAQLQKSANGAVVAVISVPDKLRGNVIVGVVEGPKNEKLAQAMIKMCRDNLGLHAAPRQIVFVDEMPLLNAGKPDLIGLSELVR